MAQLPGLALVLVPLLAGAAAAKPEPERERKERHVTLSAVPAAIRVAPGVITTLAFDAELNRQSVELDRTRFSLVDVGEWTVNLEPVAALGSPIELQVRFADESRSMPARFTLFTAASEVDSQVKVFRDARSPEALQARVVELEARGAACEAELAAQRERGKVSGPAGVVLSKQVGNRGVRTTLLSPSSTGTAGLKVSSVRRFLADGWVVLELVVQGTAGQPWRPGAAWLEHPSSGHRRQARTVAMEPEVLLPETVGRVVVEFEETGEPGLERVASRLRVEEADGPRSLVVSGVVLEEGPLAQEKSGP